MFKYHLSRKESTDESLDFNNCFHSLFINLDAILVFFSVRVILLILLLEMSFLFICIDELIINFLWGSFTKSFDVKWGIALLFLLRSSRRYFKVLLVEICVTTIVCMLTFRVLILFIKLLVLALLLHLLHWIVEPEIPTVYISAACIYNSVYNIITGHIIVIGRAHLIMPVLVLLIDFTVITVLILSMLTMPLALDCVLRTPWVVGIRVLETVFVWLVQHSGQRCLLQNIRFVKSVPMIIDIASGLHSIRTFRWWEQTHWWFSHCLYQASMQSVKLGESGGNEIEWKTLTVLISDSVSPVVQLLQALPMFK